MGRNEQLVQSLRLMEALVVSRTGVSVREFAEQHDLVVRTVRRLLHAIGNVHPLEEVSKGRYRLMWQRARLPSAALAPDELLAIDVARRNAASWRKTRLGAALDRAWAKLSTPAREEAAPVSSAAEVAANRSMVATAAGRPGAGHKPEVPQHATSGVGEVEPSPREPQNSARLTFGEHLGVDYQRAHRIIATIESALAEQRAVHCTYRRIRGGELTERVIEPGELHYSPSLDALYVIAYCRLRQDVRVFAIHRFVSAKTIDSSIQPRAQTRSAAALKRSFRVWCDENVHRVHLRFSGDLVAYIAERRIHRSQKVTRNPDTTLDLTFDVAGTQEVLHWILSFGSAVTVLAPPALRAAHRAELVAALGRYGGGNEAYLTTKGTVR